MDSCAYACACAYAYAYAYASRPRLDRLLLPLHRMGPLPPLRFLAPLLLPLLIAGCAGARAAAPDAASPQVASCVDGTDSDGNACVARQPAAQPKPPPPAAATTPPALAALLAPPDRSAPSPDLGPSAELAHLGADRMYQVAWTFQQGNDFDSARAIYGDLLNYFPDTPRAAYARFEMGEMYLKEGLAFGAYLSDAADAFAQVAGDPRADPPLVSFALMRLEQTSELTGDATRAAESKDRLTREFPRSDAAKSLLAKSR